MYVHSAASEGGARRLEKRVLIPLPDVNGRLVMIKIHLGKEENILSAEDFRHLAHITEGSAPAGGETHH